MKKTASKGQRQRRGDGSDAELFAELFAQHARYARLTLDRSMRIARGALILDALRSSDGNVTLAARSLGIHRNTVTNWLNGTTR